MTNRDSVCESREHDNGGWREDVEARLDAVASMVELNAETMWEAKVHALVCEAWRIMVDHREAGA